MQRTWPATPWPTSESETNAFQSEPAIMMLNCLMLNWLIVVLNDYADAMNWAILVFIITVTQRFESFECSLPVISLRWANVIDEILGKYDVNGNRFWYRAIDN